MAASSLVISSFSHPRKYLNRPISTSSPNLSYSSYSGMSVVQSPGVELVVDLGDGAESSPSLVDGTVVGIVEGIHKFFPSCERMSALH